MDTITLTIPADWLEGANVSQAELRQALQLGLAQLQRQRTNGEITNRVIEVLVSTGRVRHLTTAWIPDEKPEPDRQSPPTLPGPPVSEILIRQRRGEL